MREWMHLGLFLLVISLLRSAFLNPGPSASAQAATPEPVRTCSAWPPPVTDTEFSACVEREAVEAIEKVLVH